MTAVELRHILVRPNAEPALQAEWLRDLATADIVTLDLTDERLSARRPGNVRLDLLRVCLLANLVSGLPSTTEITVTLPRNPSLQRQLARTPLLSVLAQHDQLHVDGDDAWQSNWRRTWDPHDRQQLEEALVRQDEPSAYLQPTQDSLLTFVSPHLRNRSTVHGDLVGVVQPWVARRYLPLGRTSQQTDEMAALNIVMGELAENIVDHAFPTAGRSSRRSIAQVMSTAGGRDSHDRFRMIVMDNGVGLPRSIKARRGDLDAKSALRLAFEGRLRYGARGRGLGRVRSEVAPRPGSTFVMFTEFLRERSKAFVITVSEGQVDVLPIGVPIIGTLAIGQIALPSLAKDQPSLFDELSDGELVTLTV